jgi:hypothetical protein
MQSLTPDDWQSDTLPTSDLNMKMNFIMFKTPAIIDSGSGRREAGKCA